MKQINMSRLVVHTYYITITSFQNSVENTSVKYIIHIYETLRHLKTAGIEKLLA